MELILVVVISAGMSGNSQNGVSRSLSYYVNLVLLSFGYSKKQLILNG